MLANINPLVLDRQPEVEIKTPFPGAKFNDGEKIIKGPGFFAKYPVLEKKNKLRPCYVVLRNVLCELHKSYKDFEMCRTTVHCIALKFVFNVCILKDMVGVKGECLCVMTADDTYYIDLDKNYFDVQSFCDEFLARSREARSDELSRPVYLDEYFEASWDIQVIKKPKLYKEYPTEEKYPDLTTKHPEMLGHRRICVRPTSIVLFKINIAASPDIDNPYTRDTFFDFPINMISSYGKQEKYFFMQIGQCSEWGKGELWLACETGPAAKVMHERIDEINQRETDRRRELGIVLSYPGMSQQMLKSKQYRERSATQHAAERKAYEEAQKKLNGTWEKEQEELRKKAEEAAKKKAEEEAARLAEEKRNKGIMGAVRRLKGDGDKKGLSAIFRFGKDKKKKDDELNDENFDKELQLMKDCVPKATNNYPQYNVQEDYMPYDHRVDSRKASALIAPFKQMTVGFKPDKKKMKPVPKDYVQMDTSYGDEFLVRRQYIFPFIETQVYIKEEDLLMEKMKKKKRREEERNKNRQNYDDRRSPSSEKAVASTSAASGNLESRAYSVGSKPKPVIRRGPMTPSSSLLNQPRGESATGSLNTVGSIAEEDEDVEEEEDEELLDDQPSTSAASIAALQQQQPGPSTQIVEPKQTTIPKTSSTQSSNLLTVQHQQQKSTEEAEAEEDEKDVATDLVDIRKRAHSLGSRSWIKSAALRKLTSKLHGRSSQNSNHNNSQGSVTESVEDDRSRTGSTGSQASYHTGPRRYMNEYGEEEEGDLMEIDFDATSKTDSPLNRSRNSSLGMKTPLEIKTALDKAMEEKKREQLLAKKERERKARERERAEKARAEQQVENGLPANERIHTTSPVNQKPSTSGTRKSNRSQRAAKQPVLLDEDEYVQIAPASPTSRERQLKSIEADKADRERNGNKRHRHNCRKKVKSREPEREHPRRGFVDTENIHFYNPCDSPTFSISSLASDDPILQHGNSSDSLEKLERGEGMICFDEEPSAENILTRRLARPLSYSIGNTYMFHGLPPPRHLAHTAPRNRAATTSAQKKKSTGDPTRKSSALTNTSSTSKKKSTSRLEEEKKVQPKKSEQRSLKDQPSTSRNPSTSHRPQLLSQSSRHLRSPSPKTFDEKECTNPGCSVCCENGRRPRTSFIDTAALLASPANSRKHSTNVTPKIRDRNESLSRNNEKQVYLARERERHLSTSRERRDTSTSRERHNSTSSRRHPSSARDPLMPSTSRDHYSSTSTQRKISSASSRKPSNNASQKLTVAPESPRSVYVPQRKSGAMRNPPIMFDMTALNWDDDVPSTSSNGQGRGRRERRDSAVSQRSSHSRQRRKQSFGTYHKISSKHHRGRSIPTSIRRSSVDYVEIVAPKSKKKKKRTTKEGERRRRRRGQTSESASEQSFVNGEY